MPDFSFIVVSWNAQAYLRQCLDSIVADSSGLDVEVIVVDNVSSDGSPEMVEAEYPWVAVVRNDANVGFARANNQGIAVSAAEYLCLVNSDVVIHPGCLAEMKRFLDAHPEIGLAGPKVLNSDGTLQLSCRDTPNLRSALFRSLGPGHGLSPIVHVRRALHDRLGPRRGSRRGVLSGCCWFARREAVGEVGGLNEAFFMYGEDMDWCLRFNRSGWQVVFNPTPTITHYGGASSSRQPTRFFIEMQRADLQYWRMHHGLPAFLTYYVGVVVHTRVGLSGTRCCGSCGRRVARSPLPRWKAAPPVSCACSRCD